ncbi:hypothetical protein DOY81_009405, partial [Sarcophaga bullata]
MDSFILSFTLRAHLLSCNSSSSNTAAAAILGTIVLGTGIWLAVDKASLIALLKMVENENIM